MIYNTFSAWKDKAIKTFLANKYETLMLDIERNENKLEKLNKKRLIFQIKHPVEVMHFSLRRSKYVR